MEGDKQVVPACVYLEKNPVAEEGECAIALYSSHNCLSMAAQGRQLARCSPHTCLSMSAQGRYLIALGDAVEGVRQALLYQGQDGHQAGGYKMLCGDILEVVVLSNCSPRPGALLVENGAIEVLTRVLYMCVRTRGRVYNDGKLEMTVVDCLSSIQANFVLDDIEHCWEDIDCVEKNLEFVGDLSRLCVGMTKEVERQYPRAVELSTGVQGAIDYLGSCCLPCWLLNQSSLVDTLYSIYRVCKQGRYTHDQPLVWESLELKIHRYLLTLMRSPEEEISGQEGWPQFEGLLTDHGSDSSGDASSKQQRHCRRRGERTSADRVCSAEYRLLRDFLVLRGYESLYQEFRDHIEQLRTLDQYPYKPVELDGIHCRRECYPKTRPS